MQTFVTVVETGSFSGAARRLRIGQPAVSKIVAQLEDRLGLRLLLRSTRRLNPTEAGQTFYEHAKRAVAEADEAELAARGAGVGLTGRLRVSAAVTFARLHIVPKLGRFLDQHPALDIELVLDDRYVDLVGEGIDVALRMGSLTDSTLTARRIAGNRRLVVASRDYVARADRPHGPGDLMAHPSIVYAVRSASDDWTFQKGGENERVVLSGRIRTTAAEGMREAVIAGLGLAIATEWMFTPELRDGSVVQLLPDWTLPDIELWAVFPTGRRASVKARLFAAFAEQVLAEQAP